ncbi:YggS family pyridoxal phosphate-dependent enzyme [Candidatus Kapabacteria bacterium]|nr:YggS family pyridoxal phosphate-dependent enzyme [Candidatus Kapabacteria bacterium]
MISKEDLSSNLDGINSRISIACKEVDRDKDAVKLIPVSKVFPPEVLALAQEIGVKYFGESYAQELKSKYEWFESNNLKQPEWHFIGHLQRNKVKYIAPFVHTIHAVDSLKLAKAINKEAIKSDRVINILLQVNTSEEESKYGFTDNELLSSVIEINNLSNVKINGLMTIAGLDATIDENIIEFRKLKEMKHKVSKLIDTELKELSMGMSADFEEAIKNGSTIVRVGSAIFGNRK